jgi:hypothetical protein
VPDSGAYGPELLGEDVSNVQLARLVSPPPLFGATVPLPVRFCVVAPPPTWVTVPLTDPVAADALNRTYTVTVNRLPLVGTKVLLPPKMLLSKLTSYPVGAVTTTLEVRFDPLTV